MLRRILRSLMTFAALVAVYQTYVWLALPWMEPPLAVRQTRSPTDGQKQHASQGPTKYKGLLAAYFPADHWTQVRPPKVIASSNEQAMLVLDDYTRHEDGRVDIERFALLVFPTPPRQGITPPRDAIVLEAPQGAKLQFDSFRPERGEIGRITRGKFPGRIAIRSDMREPGPHDDLLVETADLEMNTKLMYTKSPVRFRMGQNVGGGRELEIRFIADEHSQPSDQGLKIAGIDSLEIRRDVRLRLFLEIDNLLPGDKKKSPPPTTTAPAKEKEPQPPVEVTCSGPFHFDFVRYVASFDRDVELRQINADGPSDQLSAQQLDIHFTPRQPPGGGPAPIVDPSQQQHHDLGRLEPAAVVAQGHPVVVVSPANSAEARGGRVQLGLRDRRVIVSGGPEVMLVYGTNVLRAPAIEYQHPAREEATRIGRFRATGPGVLNYVVDPNRPEQLFQASWQTSVELGRYQGQPLLTLAGRPRLGVAEMGGLTADRIHVHLRELEESADPTERVALPGAIGESSKLQVIPDRLAATGGVEIESAELTGRTEELVVDFQVDAATGDGATAAPGGDDQSNSLAAQLNRSAAGGPPQQAYHIDTDRLRILVMMRGKKMSPANLACDGNVVFREIPLVATQEQPMHVRGEHLKVEGIDSDMQITIAGSAQADQGGAAGTQEPPSQVAQLSARGMTVMAREVHLDQRRNRLWIEGPGKATIVVSRDLTGQATATPFPLDINWQGGLDFDGRSIVLDRHVLVSGADDWLRCHRMKATLNTTIEFGKQIEQKNIDLAEVDCLGQVALDHRSHDAQGQTSHERMENLDRLTINQQTGAITGQGAGVIRSTHFSDQMSALTGPLAATKPPAGAAATTGGSKLHYLRMDFQRGLEGNLNRREMRFLERVRTVYGPVDSWEQELDGSRPESLPPESVTLACDELWVNEDPLAARALAAGPDGEQRKMGPVQMQAIGNVRIDGVSESQGNFGAQAERASYEQSKDVFVLEGTPAALATLWFGGAGDTGGRPFEALRITYSRSTGQVQAKVKYIEYVPTETPQSARVPGPQRQ